MTRNELQIIEHWKRIFDMVEQSGDFPKEWCRKNGIEYDEFRQYACIFERQKYSSSYPSYPSYMMEDIKDEAKERYSVCKTIEEVRAVIDEYVYYFNYERATRTHEMSPVKYEKYLSSLSEEDFQKYLDEETEKYKAMKKHSAERVRKKAEAMGAFDSEVESHE